MREWGLVRAARAVGLLMASVLCGCEPDAVVGQWTCLKSTGPAGPLINDAGAHQGIAGPVKVPWTTSFEDAFCGYQDAKGWCYSDDGSDYESVSSPVHSGQRAA